VPFAVSDHFARGGEGAVELAKLVVEHSHETHSPFTPLYALDESVPDKIRAVARKMYGARNIVLTKRALRDLEEVKKLGFDKLPVCIAKTQSSLSDDPSMRGRPKDFDVTVSGISISNGAGFLVVMTGEILRMPGLPKHPQSEQIDYVDGQIIGIK
jgi:formate--tetrahydrofolate ligase